MQEFQDQAAWLVADITDDNRKTKTTVCLTSDFTFEGVTPEVTNVTPVPGAFTKTDDMVSDAESVESVA